MVSMVTLISGTRVRESIVRQVLLHLELAASPEYGLTLAEILALAGDPDHRPFGNTGQRMNELGFLTHWDPETKKAVMHDHWRAVVLVALGVRGPETDLVNRHVALSIDEVDESDLAPGE